MAKFCGQCGARLDTKTGLCPNCDRAKIARIYLDELRKRKIKIILSFTLSVLIAVVMAVILVQRPFSRNELTSQDYQDYSSAENLMLGIEENYYNDKGFVEASQVKNLLDDVEKALSDDSLKDSIDYYEKNEDTIYVQFSSGIGYVFIPHVEDTLGGGTENAILTLEPIRSSLRMNAGNLFSKWADLEYGDTFWPSESAKMITDAFPLDYEYTEGFHAPNKGPYSLKNSEVTVDMMKHLDQYKVVIWEGHGAFSPTVHSCLVTGETYVGLQDLSPYIEDITDKNIVLTSFKLSSGIERRYCVTSKFFDKYLKEMDNSLVFLGACESGRDNVLANSFLNKGASVVLGFSKVTDPDFEMLSRTIFFHELVGDGKNAVTVQEALDIAVARLGKDRHGSTLCAFFNPNEGEKFSLTDKTGTALDSKNDEIFGFLPRYFDIYCCSHDGDSAFNLNPDGTFTWVNEWWDWGSQGDGYPNGTCEISTINGRFSNLTQVNEYTYKMSLDYVEQSGEVGREYIENNVRYVVTEDTRLSKANEFYIYLPGTKYDIDYMSGEISTNGKCLFTLPPWDEDWEDLFEKGCVLYIDTMPALISAEYNSNSERNMLINTSIPYFEEKGYVCNMTELNKPYDYHTRSREDASIPVKGKLIVTDYETYPSDEEHEAMEGYEWKSVRFDCWIPLSEMEHGGLSVVDVFDYYEKDDEPYYVASNGVQYPYAIEWKGINYDDGLVEWSCIENTHEYNNSLFNADCWHYVWELNIRVPVGYDGVVFTAYNRTPEIETMIAEGLSIEDIILSSDDTFSFRLN